MTSDHHDPERIRLGNLEVALDSYQATLDGRPLELTYVEFELLAELARHPDIVRLRRELLEAVWGDARMEQSRRLDVQVSRLRRKLQGSAPWAIETVRRRGYVLRARPPAAQRNPSSGPIQLTG